MALSKTWVTPAEIAAGVSDRATLNAQLGNLMLCIASGLWDGDDGTSSKYHRHASGTLANRPAAASAGRLYFVTSGDDTGMVFIDTGSEWWPLGPRIVRKTADESVTSSTTMQDDDHLKVALAASEVWAFEAFLIAEGVKAGDIKLVFTIPAGASGRYAGHGMLQTADPGAGSDLVMSTVVSALTEVTNWGLATGSSWPITLWGTVVNSTTAGDLQLQFAQVASDGTATKLITNSWLKATRIA